MSDETEVEILRAENARLTALLKTHGIEATPLVSSRDEEARVRKVVLAADEKVALFRRLTERRVNGRLFK